MVTAIVVFVLCILYGIASSLYSKSKKEESVILAEAGSVSNASEGVVLVPHMPRKLVRISKDRLVRTDDPNYIRIVIGGTCMTPKQVLQNEDWLAEKINLVKDKNKIHEGNIVLIYLKDKDMYKIREFIKYDGNGDLLTQYYNADEEAVPSSKPHTKESVKAVLRYQI
jgi:hypothetical protein